MSKKVMKLIDASNNLMKLIDANNNLMECRVCGARHWATIEHDERMLKLIIKFAGLSTEQAEKVMALAGK